MEVYPLATHASTVRTGGWGVMDLVNTLTFIWDLGIATLVALMPLAIAVWVAKWLAIQYREGE